MNYVTLNNGVKIPQIGLGVFRLPEEEEAVRTVKMGLENGYRHIDTATIYQNEAAVGRAVRESGVPRDEIFITTKVWNDKQRTGEVEASFEASLKALDTDYIDLYLVHWPVPAYFKNTWKKLEKIYSSGKIRAVGVSNFRIQDLKALEEVSDLVPAVNQIELQPYFQQYELVEYCESKGIKVEAWGPFTAGKTGLFKEPVLVNLSEKYGKTPAQIILRFDVQRGIIPLPKSSSPARQKENLDVFDFELTNEEMGMLKSMDCGGRVGRNPDNSDFE
ncbi:aldo/keto reductase [Anaerolentibacter hominis]|uniref:aldo/keto reductase n=1 Tax=Anaerolentibacter hominis TaxID=3079009 RepID=UPI0031B8A692